MSHDDFAFEPIRGLPETPPEGEEILWQGAPTWGNLARRAFHVKTVALYFGILIAWSGATTFSETGNMQEALIAASRVVPAMLIGCALLTVLAWLYARSTVYTITNRRVVIRFGLALPMAVNLPFKTMESIKLKEYRDKSGDIPMVLLGRNRVSYLPMWPNVRPWMFSPAQPMLRGVPEAAPVAKILGEAFAAYVEQEEIIEETVTTTTSTKPNLSRDVKASDSNEGFGPLAPAGGS